MSQVDVNDDLSLNSPEGPDPLAEEILGGEGKAVSPFEDPMGASALSAQAVLGEKPKMADDYPTTVELPGGYVDDEGNLHTVALVKELTGRDEERLAKVNIVTMLPSYLQTMVEGGVEAIGPYPATSALLKKLLVGDREMLIIGIRMATYGTNIEMHIVCPACEAEEDIIFELDKDIPIRKMETPEKREYEVPLHGGHVAIVTPVTVGMQDEVWDVKKTPAEIKTATLARAVLAFDGIPMNYEMAQNLGSGHRKALLTALADLQPGPDYEGVRLSCGTCNQQSPLRLDLTTLFR